MAEGRDSADDCHEPPQPANGRRRVGADELLAAALAAGQDVAAAAAQAGLSERSAYRRLSEPEFRERVATLRAEMVEQAVGKLSGTMGAAADKLRELLGSKSEKVQLAAAKAVLDSQVKLREATELVARLDAIELALRKGDRQ